ncbi:NAD-dependent epimerase/dehydratase family protein [Luedemannella flava]
MFARDRPRVVVDCAARVGGIGLRRDHPTEFLLDNLEIQNNLIRAAVDARVAAFVFISSASVYPADCPQPMREEHLFTGPFEATQEAYALAKAAGMKLCEYVRTEYDLSFVSCLPTNLYGEQDELDPGGAHVIPALLRRMHDARLADDPAVTVWGSGATCRDFLHVDDAADAVVWLLGQERPPAVLNIGTGREVSVRDLAETVQRVVGYPGRLVFDASMPEGPRRRLLDVSRAHAAGWRHTIELEDGLRRLYDRFLAA